MSKRFRSGDSNFFQAVAQALDQTRDGVASTHPAKSANCGPTRLPAGIRQQIEQRWNVLDSPKVQKNRIDDFADVVIPAAEASKNRGSALSCRNHRSVMAACGKSPKSPIAALQEISQNARAIAKRSRNERLNSLIIKRIYTNFRGCQLQRVVRLAACEEELISFPGGFEFSELRDSARLKIPWDLVEAIEKQRLEPASSV